MSGWIWFVIWLVGFVFVHGMLRVVKPSRRSGDGLATLIAAWLGWPYILLSALGALFGVALIKAGVK